MKNTIYKIGFLLSIFAITFSCTSPEAEANYTPANYEFPSAINLATENITNSSFDFTYTLSGGGTGYYVILEGGSDAPSNQDVFDATANGMVDSGSFDLTGSPVSITTFGLCDGSTYDVYAVQFTSDNFLSASPVSITLSTMTNASLGGTWDVVTNGVMSGNFDGEIVTDYAGVVTITDNGDGTFTFDDTTAGIYPEYYSAFAFIDPTFADPVPYTFDVPCNTISGSYPSTLAAFGDSITFEGTINGDGSLSVHWESGFGEVMDAIYTKQ